MTHYMPENLEIKKQAVFEALKSEDVAHYSEIKIDKLIEHCEGMNITLRDISYFLRSAEFAETVKNCRKLSLGYMHEGNLAEYKEFIESFVEDGTFRPKSIKVDYAGYKDIAQAVKIMNITTGIKVFKGSDSDDAIICQKFYKELCDTDDEITQERLIECIKASTIKYKIGYLDSLKIISEFDWTLIENIPENLNASLKEVRDLQKVESEIYSMHQSDGLDFNMVKVTALNVDKWKKFTSGQAVTGFNQALGFYDYNDTEVWVAYITNKPISDPNYVYTERGRWDITSSIGMYVTVTTSPGPLTTNMGITRIQDFCKGQSPNLHSFTAKMMLDRYPNKKYMINVPLPIAKNIIIDSFDKSDKSDAIHFWQGSNTKSYNSHTIESLSEAVQHAVTKSFGIDAIVELKTQLNLLKEKISIAKGERFAPIKVEHIENTDTAIVTVRDHHDGKDLCVLDQEEQNGSFAWFFHGAHQWGSCKNGTLVICELDQLAEIGRAGELTHQSFVSTIGDPDTHLPDVA